YYHTAFEFNTNDIEIKYKVDGAPTVSASTFTSEFQAGLDLAATQGWKVPTLDQQIAENISLKDAITKGFFAQAPRFYNFYSKCTDENWRGINWKSPSTSTQATFEGGATQLSDGGVHCDGEDGYIDFHWNPSTQGGGLVSATNMGVAADIRDWVRGIPLYGIFGSQSFELRCLSNTIQGRLNTNVATGQIS